MMQTAGQRDSVALQAQGDEAGMPPGLAGRIANAALGNRISGTAFAFNGLRFGMGGDRACLEPGAIALYIEMRSGATIFIRYLHPVPR